MKKRGIVNEALSGALARLGHTHHAMVGDCGLPRPDGVPVVDLAVTFGAPTFAQVIDARAAEILATHEPEPLADDVTRYVERVIADFTAVTRRGTP